jgi:hypothetical protein
MVLPPAPRTELPRARRSDSLSLMRSCALVLAFMLGGCRSRDAAPDAATLDLDARPVAQYRVAGAWKRDGVEWRALVIANIPRAELKRLARSLHATEPNVFFDIYDDDAELPKLVAANGDDDVLSTSWRETHAIGTIAGTVATVDGKIVVKSVQLYEWKTQQTTPLNGVTGTASEASSAAPR